MTTSRNFPLAGKDPVSPGRRHNSPKVSQPMSDTCKNRTRVSQSKSNILSTSLTDVVEADTPPTALSRSHSVVTLLIHFSRNLFILLNYMESPCPTSFPTHSWVTGLLTFYSMCTFCTDACHSVPIVFLDDLGSLVPSSNILLLSGLNLTVVLICCLAPKL